MTLRATRHYKIVRPGEIHPTAFNAGDEVPEWAAEKMLADGAAEAGAAAASDTDAETDAGAVPSTPAAGVDTGATDRAVRLVAKTTRAVEIDVDGKPAKFKRGVTVYDEIARRLIADGAAEAPPEDKALPGAPENK